MSGDTVGGVWTYAIDLSRALGAAGVEVILATMGAAATPEQRTQARKLTNLALVESSYRLPWMEQPWHDVHAAGDWLRDLAERLEPDVIHLNEPVHGSLAWPAPTVAVTHSCVASWWESVWHRPVPPEWDRYRHEMRRGLQGAGAVVAPSRWMLDAVSRHYGLSRGCVIANGRDGQAFAPAPKAPVVFAAGRLWDEAKNFQALDRVAPDLPWPVYLAGDAQHPGGRQGMALGNCRLLGRIPSDEVASWLGQASIFVSPAKYEPFGLAVLEAALSGCALVLSDLPTLRENWDGAAVFVEPEEDRTLRLTLESLIASPNLRDVLARRARSRALELTPERMAGAYLAVYRSLLTAPRTRVEDQACAS
jgi:glycogen synthase